MEKQFVTTSESPKILVTVHSNLTLKGWDEMRVVAKTEAPNDLSLEQREDEVVVRCQNSCSLRVPRGAMVVIEAVHGDTLVKAMEGELEIQTVHGNLDLRGVGPTTIGLVHGNLTAKDISGTLKINHIEGNAFIRDVQGDFLVEGAVQGNLRLNDVDGSANAQIDGNAELRLDPTPGQAHRFSANGNIFCRLMDDTSAVILIERADRITLNLPDIETASSASAPYSLTLGEGDAALNLSAGANVMVSTHAPEWNMIDDIDVEIGPEFDDLAENITQQVTQQIEAQMQLLEQQLNAQMSSLSASLGTAGLSEDRIRRIEERTRAASERIAARTQERMRLAQEKLERKLASAQRKAEHKARAAERHALHRQHRGFSFVIPTPPGPPSPPVAPSGEPVSDEERLAILRMLEEKKISLEEAEALLAALEGQEG